jgi:hypothetical protein
MQTAEQTRQVYRFDHLHNERQERGVEGNIHTLRRMAQMVRQDALNPVIRDYAIKVLDVYEVAQGDRAGQVAALFYFVRDQIRFVDDPTSLGERIQDAYTTILHKAGDCADKTELLAALLASIGYVPRFGVLELEPPAQGQGDVYRHVYVELETPAAWLPLDASAEHGAIGWSAPAFKRASFTIFHAPRSSNLGSVGSTINSIIQAVGNIVKQGSSNNATADEIDQAIAAQIVPYIQAVRNNPSLATDATWQEALQWVDHANGGPLTKKASDLLYALTHPDDLHAAAAVGLTATTASDTTATTAASKTFSVNSVLVGLGVLGAVWLLTRQ